MKKNITLFLFIILITGNSNSQLAFTTLDQNNCSAIISDVGQFFNNPAASSAGYEVPSGSGHFAIYSASMWFGGVDVNGQIKLAAPKYYPSQDLWPGALTADGAANPVNPNPLGQTLWMVTKDQINDHIYNYQNPGYVIPGDILNWPAHGDVLAGQAYYLAPFVDVDNDGDYVPANGDYPCIKGDEAVYTIVNDKADIHGSGGAPIGIEVHYMFYQFSTVPELNDITFIEAHVINRGTQTIFDYVSTFFSDPDLGNNFDDFVGCDSTRNLMYTYNADGFDEDNAGHVGYGAAPPAIGVVCLSNDVSSIGLFTNGQAQPYSDPTNEVEYKNLMNGYWTNGSDWLDNNGQPTKFLYSGDPNNLAEWSEVSALNVSGDRRMLMSIEHPNQLIPNDEYTLTYAVVFAQGTDNLSSVSELFQVTDVVQAYYDNMTGDCYGSNVGLAMLDPGTISIYPNPSKGTFILDLSEDFENFSVEMLDMSGRIIEKTVYAQGGKVDFVTNASPGVYVVHVRSNRGDLSCRVVIE